MIQTERPTGPANNRQTVTGTTVPRPQGPFRPPGRSAAPAESRSPAARSAAPQQAARGGGPHRRGRPFRDAEACIMWMVQTLAAEAEGAPLTAGPRQAGPGQPGPRQPGPRQGGPRQPATSICTPAEVVKCLDTLYRRRRIDLHHVRVLRLWGHRGRAPDAANPMEKADWRIWREAVDRLDWPLRSLGIIS